MRLTCIRLFPASHYLKCVGFCSYNIYSYIITNIWYNHWSQYVDVCGCIESQSAIYIRQIVCLSVWFVVETSYTASWLSPCMRTILPLWDIRQFFNAKHIVKTSYSTYILFNANIFTLINFPDSKVHGANMGPTWVLSAPDGPHVGTMNLAIRDDYLFIVLGVMQATGRWANGSAGHSRIYASPGFNLLKSAQESISCWND